MSALMMRVADYIAQTLAAQGVRHVFMVTGGAAMHLNDAFGRCRQLTYICCHHEQACAMAAESYFRLTNRLAAVNVTAGPGGTNAVTGVFGAYVDSLGMVVISGQVKRETMVQSTGLALRQLGDQEVDIVRLVQPITKYAVVINDPQTIRYHLERALHLAASGRPGPVWLDVPIDVQAALVDPATLRAYDPAEDALHFSTADLRQAAGQIVEKLRQAKRPVILGGGGVRIGGAYDLFLQLLDRWHVPVVTAWNSHDLVPDAHPCYVGRPGTIGDRAGNFAVQNADFLLVLGCRLNIRQISYGWKTFARAAWKAVVDIDENELKKPTIQPDLPVHAPVTDVLRKLLADAYCGPTAAHRDWLHWCLERRWKYPAVLPEYWATTVGVNPYCFAQALFEQLPAGQTVVTGDGTACVATFQAAVIKPGQRLYTNSGSAPMGFDLPAAVGACIAGDRRPVVCIAGDGSLQMNVQELATISGLRLPVKIFVLNNNGYHSIRQTQGNYFPDNVVGCGPESGLFFPNYERLAQAYGLTFRRCVSHVEMAAAIRQTLAETGPALCEVVLALHQGFAPKVSSERLAGGRMVSRPLEDMHPFLDRQELRDNMLIDLIEE